MGAEWNTETWRIIRNMSPIELEMLADRGFPLPPDLVAKVQAWRAGRLANWEANWLAERAPVVEVREDDRRRKADRRRGARPVIGAQPRAMRRAREMNEAEQRAAVEAFRAEKLKEKVA